MIISFSQFRWKYRRRLRLTMSGQQEKIYAPAMELYSQQLQYPEYRYLDSSDHDFLRLVLEKSIDMSFVPLPSFYRKHFIGMNLSHSIFYIFMKEAKSCSYSKLSRKCGNI